MEDAIITGLVSIAGSSSVVGLLIRFMLKRLTSDWGEMSAAIKTLVGEMHAIKTRIAVHEALAADNRHLRTEIDEVKREVVVLQTQMLAAWRVLDQPRISDRNRG